MKGKSKPADLQLNVRFTEDDMKSLERCQRTLGGLSQADTIKVLMQAFFGKIPGMKVKHVKIQKVKTKRKGK